MKEIQLTQGLVALVDDEDFERVNAFKWHAFSRNHWVTYAARNLPRDGSKRQRIFMHTFITGVRGADHRDNNGLNNQKSNLRPATGTQNNANARKRKGASSRFRGVSWKSSESKWWAQIQKHGKAESLGLFADEVDAATAYNLRVHELFGEFAKFNTPEMGA